MDLFQSRYGSRINLTSRDLLSIGERISRGFSPVFPGPVRSQSDRIRFSQNELRAISEEISREFMLRRIPRQSESQIVLMPVDPGHLHAYWHLDDKDKENASKRSLTVRLYPLQSARTLVAGNITAIDVAVAAGDSQCKIAVPDTLDGGDYCAAIGWRPKSGRFQAIACSESVCIPRGRPAGAIQEPGAAGIGRRVTLNASGRGRRIV